MDGSSRGHAGTLAAAVDFAKKVVFHQSTINYWVQQGSSKSSCVIILLVLLGCASLNLIHCFILGKIIVKKLKVHYNYFDGQNIHDCIPKSLT